MQTRISNDVEIKGKRLVYEMAGEGETLIFAHAGFLDRHMWDDQWQPFSQKYRVVRYDMRGYGDSDALDGPTSRRAELHALLTHLDIESAYLVGCSIGGEMMLDFALEHPEMVKALVMINSAPSGFELQGEPPADVLALIDAMQQGNLERMAELQLRIWIDGPTRQPNQVDPQVRQRAWAMTQTPVRRMTWATADMQPANPLHPPAAQQLHNVHVPTLVMMGALDDPEVLRAGNLMAAEIMGAQKAVIANAAHIPSMEQPAAFNRIVLKFLQNHN